MKTASLHLCVTLERPHRIWIYKDEKKKCILATAQERK
jgi:hypothetical protein